MRVWKKIQLTKVIFDYILNIIDNTLNGVLHPDLLKIIFPLLSCSLFIFVNELSFTNLID